MTKRGEEIAEEMLDRVDRLYGGPHRSRQISALARACGEKIAELEARVARLEDAHPKLKEKAHAQQ